METRRLGKTGGSEHDRYFRSGGFLAGDSSQADAAMEMAAAHGINHIDVSPTYGQAEVHLGAVAEG